jgi:hypothetical protein
MWAIKGSIPRIILYGFVSSILTNFLALGILAAFYSLGIQLFHSIPILAVSVTSTLVGMVVTGGMTYALYLDELDLLRVCGEEPTPV